MVWDWWMNILLHSVADATSILVEWRNISLIHSSVFVNVYYFHVCFYNPSANCFGSNQLVHNHAHRAGRCIRSLHLCNPLQHSFVVGTCGVAIKFVWCIPLLSVPGNVGTTVELSVFTPWACIEYGLVAMFLKTIFTLSPTSAWIWGPEWSERKISLLFWNFCVNDKSKIR